MNKLYTLIERIEIQPEFSPAYWSGYDILDSDALREERDTLREIGAPNHMVRAATAAVYAAEELGFEPGSPEDQARREAWAEAWAEYGHAVLDAARRGAPWPKTPGAA